jgi:lycopene beta-cyclase
VSRPVGRAGSSRSVFDVAVLGAGPAGWATAAACAAAGLRSALIAPTPLAVWRNTYGAWSDDLDPAVVGLDVPVRSRWDRVHVVGARRHEVGRTYVQLDNAALLDRLAGRFGDHGGELIDAAAQTVEPGSESGSEPASVGLERGRTVRARVVVDATGAGSPFIRREPEPAGRAPAMQCAHGIVASIDRGRSGPEPGTATLMDWTGPDRRQPSFLYALDRGDGTWLLEETSLAGRPAMADDELERRLYDRLRAAGVRVTEVHEVERVRFRMDAPLPEVPQPVVAVGAAAAVVHPATGYSVAASLRLGPSVAAALSGPAGSAAGWSGPAGSAGWSAGWSAVWPDARRSARRLEAYGLERLLGMDQRLTRTFFDTFFTLDRADVATYLGGRADATELAAVMWRLFAAAPLRLRGALASGNPVRLARALLGS